VQPGSAFLGMEMGIVHEIVHDPAKGIKDLHVPLHGAGQHGQGVGEIGTAPAHDLTDTVGGHLQNRLGAQSMNPTWCPRGQYTKAARPTMFSWGTMPKSLESELLALLSPRAQYSPGPNFTSCRPRAV